LIRRWCLLRESAPGSVHWSRMRVAKKFSQDERAPNSPVCVIYYVLISGGFSASCLQTITKGGSSILGRPGHTCALFSDFDNPSTSSHSDDSGRATAFVPPRTPRSSGYDFLCTCGLCCYVLYVYYMLCACYVCLVMLVTKRDRWESTSQGRVMCEHY
jgi:hypothetical protein